MADNEMSSDEIMNELQWREDLGNLVNGSEQATAEMTADTGTNNADTEVKEKARPSVFMVVVHSCGLW